MNEAELCDHKWGLIAADPWTAVGCCKKCKKINNEYDENNPPPAEEK